MPRPPSLAHRSIQSFALVLIAALSLGQPAAFAADAPPAQAAVDSSVLLALRSRFAGQPPVRVSGTFERIDLRGVSADAAGLHYGEAFRRGVDPAKLPSSPIPWSRIERIETAESHIGRYVLIGALVGVAGGALWNVADEPMGTAGFLRWGTTQTGVRAGRFVVSTTAGMVLGAVVGASQRKWSTAYPAEVDAR